MKYTYVHEVYHFDAKNSHIYQNALWIKFVLLQELDFLIFT